jgi:hypothetical protein
MQIIDSVREDSLDAAMIELKQRKAENEGDYST